MFIRRAHVHEPDRPTQRGRWPFAVPCVSQLADEGLRFTAPVTFLVGDTGSGTSTHVETIAEGFTLDAYGGTVEAKRGRPNPQRTPLGGVLTLETTAEDSRMLGGPRLRQQDFFLRAETAFNLTENLAGVPGYWDEDNDTSAMSHGEGFLTSFSEMMSKPGLYVMDEPESALSFTSYFQLVGLMHQPGHSGAQVVCAPHSPILAATPGADVVELGEHGFRRTRRQDLELVEH